MLATITFVLFDLIETTLYHGELFLNQDAKESI